MFRLRGVLIGGCIASPVAISKHGEATNDSGGSLKSNLDTKLRNEALDDIIVSRRTIRTFGTDAPGEDMVLQLITAGLHAPYAKAAVELKQSKNKYKSTANIITASSIKRKGNTWKRQSRYGSVEVTKVLQK